MRADSGFSVSTGLAARSLRRGSFSAEVQLREIYLQTPKATLESAILIDVDPRLIRTFGQAARLVPIHSGADWLNLLDLLSGELKLAVGVALH